MTKDFDPKSSRFNRYVVPVAAFAAIMGSSACKNEVALAESKPDTSLGCVYEVPSGGSLYAIATEVKIDANANSDLDPIVDEIFQANKGQGAELQSPSQVSAGEEILLPNDVYKAIQDNLESGALGEGAPDRTSCKE